MTDTSVTVPGSRLRCSTRHSRESMPLGSTRTRWPSPTTPLISEAARSLTPENTTRHDFQSTPRSSRRNTRWVRFQTQCEVITVGMPSFWLR